MVSHSSFLRTTGRGCDEAHRYANDWRRDYFCNSRVVNLSGDSFAPFVEQFYPKFAFQIVDLLTERRLRNVQPIRGVREVQLLGGSDEVFKMAELHGQL